ncbi:carbohydrate esterase family 5 protein [Macrolepiota fuliginosa MF-IS2]|uniref:Carbohydrate esterase family 5 protein n=1 Tax=Macrolepiota fuliginosa MF-IS2 TaxID=1400762 RepID=A0A9P6C8K5_9AGAR|nr:carbohydrate esterase family 5 protein [Macrolepiota fuliginosa MF-IS2]
MFSKTLTAFVLTASALSVAALPAPTSPCAAVHIIAARGSTEPPGPGAIGALVTQVQQQSSQTVSTAAVDYPATLTNYANSSAQGTSATKTMLTNQANACPNQKIVLVGYSQGAHIIGDAVAGGGGVAGLGAATPPVSASIANRVNAILQLGDPRHVPGQSFDRGTSLRDGLFPRLPSQQYSSTLQPRIESFCDFNDPFCDSGLDTEVHLTYLDRYQNQAAQFILQQIGG